MKNLFQLNRLIIGSFFDFLLFQASNAQNDRIYAKEKPPTDQRVITRTQKPKSVMVMGFITHRGKGPLVFVDEGVKINQENYVEILKEHLIPWAKETFGWDEETEEYDVEWVYQQDSAPSHKAKETQRWLRENVPEFITILEWPPYSPDLNLLDYAIWGYIESIVCAKPHETVKSLKKAIKKAWDEMPDEMVQRVVDSWPGRLQACVDAQGGYIE